MSQKQLLSARAYQLIKEDIVTCVFDPGQFIAQAEAVEKYGMGLTPVREALRQLAQEGYVRPVPRLGYIVSPITTKDIQEIYEMRCILEVTSARMAAARGLDDVLETIAKKADFTYRYKDRHSYIRFLNQNAEFHLLIACAAGNQRLAKQVAKVLDELNRVFHMGLDLRDSAEEMRQDHIALAEALSKRNADLAEQHVQDEITRSRERVMEALKKYPDIPLPAIDIPAFSLEKITGRLNEQIV